MREQLKRLTQSGVKRAAVGFDTVRPPEPGVVVLAYHRVGGGTTLDVDLDPGLFAEQMAYLAEHCNVVSLDQALDALAEPDGTPSVAVTFDDGTADFVEHALPALVEHQVPATYYLATEFIDEQRSFPNDGHPLTWSAVSEAAATGIVDFGSHTHSHAVVDKLPIEAVDTELRVSCALIEEHTGRPTNHFAYPKGVAGGPEAEQAIGRHVRSAAVADGASNPFGRTRPLHLDRTPIQTSDGMRYFEAKVAGGMRLEGSLRTVLNGRRYRSSYN